MKVLVFGAGGIGIVYIYILQAGGADVTAVCRSNYEEAKRSGFKISSVMYGEVEAQPRVVRTPDEAAQYGPWDYIMVASKATPGSSPTTAEILQPAVGPDTAIILAQNGVGIEDEYKTRFPNNTIISGVVYLPATQERPGFTYHSNAELIELGVFPASDNSNPKHRKKLDDFVAVYNASKGNAKAFDEIQERRWSKLVTNASWNPMCALGMLDCPGLCEASPHASEMVVKVMVEVTKIANAKGFTSLTPEVAQAQFDRTMARRANEARPKEPSMLTDVRMGRTIEVEAILGIPTRAAKELGVEVPLLNLLYTLAKARNEAIIQELQKPQRQ